MKQDSRELVSKVVDAGLSPMKLEEEESLKFSFAGVGSNDHEIEIL